MNNFNSPAEISQVSIGNAIVKTSYPLPKMILLSILAGIFIAIGAEASNLAMHQISNVGLARLVAGCIFPVGLIMVVMLGAELFTGNCFMTQALLARKIRCRLWIKSLVVLWFGNFAGSLLVVGLIACTTQWGYSSDGLGAFTINVALGKVNLSFSQAFISGIGCNLLVCIAVLLATAAKDVIGKIAGIFVAISAFVISGFEHCVANMYYIPAGIIAAANPDYALAAQEIYGITVEQLANLSAAGLFGNLLPVTLGNIIGGALLGVIFFFCYGSKSRFFNPQKPAEAKPVED